MAFVLSKVLWVFFSPGNALVLLLLLGVFLSVAHGEKRRRVGRRLCFSLTLILFFIAVFPIGDWLLIPLANRFVPVMPDHVDGIILVGGDENPELTDARDVPSVRASAYDYIAFASLTRQYPQAKLVFTGGSNRIVPFAKLKPADVARRTLISLGLSVDKMIFEDASRNTYENAVKAAAVAHPTPQQKWLLVTGASHMPRTMGCFRKAGWNVYPIPTSYMTEGPVSTRLQFNLAGHLLEMDVAIHEYVGLIAYWLMGYTDKLWP